ncbi:MAG: DUF362 domain-containing protein [Myxococcales bacterium]|nr:DUF362 domain-containing protein [Myxococcales bacterium]
MEFDELTRGSDADAEGEAPTAHEANKAESSPALDQSRRGFLGTAAAAAAAVAVLRPGVAEARTPELAARPPAGFAPFSAPGTVVKVTKSGCLEANGIYPKPDDAREMLRRAMQELTGKADLVEATKLFVHPEDKVCVKVNGIALQNMATNKELVLPFVEAMVAAGVPASNITLLEQYPGFFNGTRITAKSVPAGVNITWHTNKDATMDWRDIPGTQRHTKFVRALTESTALINFALIKDHSICGYTGALKNMTHGCNVNPQDFHDHHASPQIAILSAQDVLRSRLRLCIADGFKVMAHGGPLYKHPEYVTPHEAVYVSTDPVAIDAVGWQVVEKARTKFGLKSLTDEGRPPAYIRAAADLGVGVADPAKIALREVAI